MRCIERSKWILVVAAALTLVEAGSSSAQDSLGALPKKVAPPVATITDSGWPRDIVSHGTTITVYQPQLDEWNGFHLTARAAVAVKEKSVDRTIYGIISLAAETDVDKERRMVTLENIDITDADFPKAEAQSQQWVSAINAHSERLRLISLDRFEAALAVSDAGRTGTSVPVKNDPPKIIVSSVPALIIRIDGKPVYRKVAGTALSRVLNARPLILRDSSGTYFLRIFDGWMTAPSLQDRWDVAGDVPADADKALRMVTDAKVSDLLVGGDPADSTSHPSLVGMPIPEIFIETKPAELIVTDGQPEWVPIERTALVYAANTTGNLFLDSYRQRAFVLISGRWFTGPTTLDGPWSFVPGSRLPDDFQDIPDSSAKENVKASVPATPQAEEAIVANSIPQTARVKRSAASFTPLFDGAPRLSGIEGTDLKAVTNSSLPIVVVAGDEGPEYYGVQDAVWFVGESAHGPWEVATNIPSPIYSIPPSSPLHYLTYVHVYDSDPTYVIVGYTPGYFGSYVSDGVVVYGTGYDYEAWINDYWWGMPITYGLGAGMVYTPWTGWAFAFGTGRAWNSGWGPYAWWGPAGAWWLTMYPWVYRPGVGVAWSPRGGVAKGPGFWSGTTGNLYARWGAKTAVTRSSGGFSAWSANRWASQVGKSYNSRTGTLSAGHRAAVRDVYSVNYDDGDTGTGPDDTYAGRDGNVYRRTEDGGWERYAPGNGLSPAVYRGGSSSQAGTAQQRRLNAEYQARARGEARTSGYERGAFRTAAPRGGGGRRR